ncbi:MAG: hypothetical protein HY852_18930 [Bradyrhizobium sp.]|uniref:hypothetical protein n=1 Tax=Bradyrhizobium sp. TaxID=376 RepID=UPI0025BA4883|nr:hypothetical protein [Bradyrhizobium sp.]MBI5263887.1 hypothetical protein [Bradyrhizobium sp.]
MAFENDNDGFLLAHFLDAVAAYGIASRNTAYSFVREMIQYNMGAYGEPQRDRRRRPLIVTQQTREAIGSWVLIHLGSLDALDGGGRCAKFRESPRLLTELHPAIVRRILSSKTTTEPDGTFSLFTWMKDGGLVMDSMIARLQDHPPGASRICTTIASFEELTGSVRITRTHLARKMALAEADGQIGWRGKRGASTLWMSNGFIAEYDAYQADKLANIDAAFCDVLSRREVAEARTQIHSKNVPRDSR